MITNFKLFEKSNNYNIDDMVLVTNNELRLNNRLVVIDSITHNRNGTEYTVWNADGINADTKYTISEKDIVKKLPTYKEGDYIMVKDYFTKKPKPMIMCGHIELGYFEMLDLEDRERGKKEYWKHEPYFNIMRKMNKKDLEKYKDLIDRYKMSEETDKYNL